MVAHGVLEELDAAEGSNQRPETHISDFNIIVIIIHVVIVIIVITLRLD